MRYVKIRKIIDIRKNTWYNKSMIRKGDTYDANDAERDDKTSQKERVFGNQSKWFSYHHEKPNYWEICSCSLSLQGDEKRSGAGNTKTGRAKISPAPEI